MALLLRKRSLLWLTAALPLILHGVLAAHDIPNDVTVQAFLKPEGGQLHVLVRAPMKALRDVEFPRRGPGYLDIARSEAPVREAAMLWIIGSFELYEAGKPIQNPAINAVRISLPSDRSFESYELANAHLHSGTLPADTDILWDQAVVDVALSYPIASEHAEFSIRPLFGRLGLRVLTTLRFVLPDGAVRPFEFAGDPGLVRLDPRWHQAALRFVKLGIGHILDGADHLLFLLCLVIPFRSVRSLILIVTAFTVAHSVALFASAYGFAPNSLWFPPLVEALIAISIVYMAIENIVGSNVQRRWLMAFAFGLVHGFGFSFVLRETFQFAGSHMLTSLVSFNLGAEVGQVLVIALLVPAISLLFRYVVQERMGTIILSAFIAHTGWHWTVDRLNRLRQFHPGQPSFDAATLAAAMQWLIVVVALAAVCWLAALLQRRFFAPEKKIKL